jgi:virginiamycin B lyase
MSGRFLLKGAIALAVLGPHIEAQAPTPTATPKAPPPLQIPFAALVPDATSEIPGHQDFAASDDAVWVSNRSAGSVSRIDPETNKVVQTIVVAKDMCVGLAAGFGGVFAPQCNKKQIARIDAKKNAPGDPIPTPLAALAHSFATGVGSVWVIIDENGTIARLDPVTNAAVAEVYTTPGATSIAFGESALWVTSPGKSQVTRINPQTNLIVETIAVAGAPSDVAVGEGAVWTWNQSEKSITRIDPKTNTIVTTIKPGLASATAARIVAGEGSVWVVAPGAALLRIDPRTNRVAQIFTGGPSGGILVAHGSVWIGGSPTAVWRLDPRRVEATR